MITPSENPSYFSRCFFTSRRVRKLEYLSISRFYVRRRIHFTGIILVLNERTIQLQRRTMNAERNE